MLRVTLESFPENPTVAKECAAPWACVITPYADVSVHQEVIPWTSASRCENCGAYISGAHSNARQRWWRCAQRG